MAKKKIKLKQLVEHIFAGGFVSQPSMMDMDMFRTKIKTKSEDTTPNIKLKSLVEEEETHEPVNAGKFNEALKVFPRLGEAIYGKHDLKSVAETLAYLAKTSRQHALSETEDWFDKVTVSRNMKELGTLSGQFNKISTEAKSLQERMSALYEDMGHIISRYYDLNEEEEELDPVGQEDDDIDNDGDSDDSDEYLRNRRKAISKAVKKESTDPWKDRNWGDPLPTLADYVKSTLKKEEKEVDEAANDPKLKSMRSKLSKLRLRIAQMENEPGGYKRAEGLRKQRDSLKDQIAKLSGSAPKQGKWSKKLGK
tara:strand:+ start:400 stop:1326 length:927 start_codon:yes stop_codon:yes gene_type:complete